MLNEALFSSRKMDWGTPQALYDELDNEFDFVLDAASSESNHKANKYFTPETDGLSHSWDCGGAVFCNPPYGKELKKWIKKAYEEAQKGIRIVLLIPARTDTSYFHDYIYGQAEIRFLRGRLKFTDENGKESGTAPFPSMLVIYN